MDPRDVRALIMGSNYVGLGWVAFIFLLLFLLAGDGSPFMQVKGGIIITSMLTWLVCSVSNLYVLDNRVMKEKKKRGDPNG